MISQVETAIKRWTPVVLIVIVAWGMIKIADNKLAQDKPPIACHMLGGQWDWWNGWRCG